MLSEDSRQADGPKVDERNDTDAIVRVQADVCANVVNIPPMTDAGTAAICVDKPT